MHRCFVPIALAAIGLAGACGRTTHLVDALDPTRRLHLDSLSVTPDSGGAPFVVRYAAAVRGGRGPVTHEWRFGDGVVVDSVAGTHVFGPLGDYEVRFVARDAVGDSVTATRRVRVGAEDFAPVDVALQASPAAAVAPADLSISCSASSGRPPYSYVIQFGDGSQIARPSGVHRYRTAGTYIVSVTAVDARGDTARRSTTVTLIPRSPPVVTVVAVPDSGYLPFASEFRSAVTGGLPPYAYLWSLSDGSGVFGNTAVASRSFETIGTYNFRLIVTDAAVQKDTASFRVRAALDPLNPTARVTPTRTMPGIAVLFAGSTRQGRPPFRYLWTFGDGDSSTLAETTHAYDAPGSYRVRFDVSDATGVRSSVTAFVAVGSPMVVFPTASPVAGKAPLDVRLRAVADGAFDRVRYDWRFGDGAVGSGDDVRHVFATPGVYRVRVVARDTASVCSSFVSVTVTAPNPIAASITATPATGPAPLDVAFRGLMVGGTPPLERVWTFGDGTASRTPEPTHRFEWPGVYPVRVDLRDAGGRTGSASMQVVVRATNSLVVDPKATPPAGLVPFTTVLASGARGGTPPYTVTWDFGDGQAGAGDAIGHVYTFADTFTATVRVRDASGDSATAACRAVAVEPAETVLEIVDDLREDGDWERWNGLVGVRIGPDRASVEAASSPYERMTAADQVANLEDAGWILPTHRRQTATNTVRIPTSDSGPHYFLNVRLGYWVRRCPDGASCSWVRANTDVQCCDCASTCLKRATIEITDHFRGTLRLFLSDLVPDDHWCSSERCDLYSVVQRIRKE